MPAVEVGRVHELVGSRVGVWMCQALPAKQVVAWVGERSWPHTQSSVAGLFVRAERRWERLLAAEAALRCRAVGGVVVDGRGFDLTATRRLQLAAERSAALLFVVRSPGEEQASSAAGVRWRMSPAVTDGERPRYWLELLRRKGCRPASKGAGDGSGKIHRSLTGISTVAELFGDVDADQAGEPWRWLMEWDPADGVRVVEDVGVRLGSASDAQTRSAG